MKESKAIEPVNKELLQFQGQDNFVVFFFLILFAVFVALFVAALTAAIKSRRKHRLTIWPRPIDNFDLDLQNRNNAVSIHYHEND